MRFINTHLSQHFSSFFYKQRFLTIAIQPPQRDVSCLSWYQPQISPAEWGSFPRPFLGGNLLDLPQEFPATWRFRLKKVILMVTFSGWGVVDPNEQIFPVLVCVFKVVRLRILQVIQMIHKRLGTPKRDCADYDGGSMSFWDDHFPHWMKSKGLWFPSSCNWARKKKHSYFCWLVNRDPYTSLL